MCLAIQQFQPTWEKVCLVRSVFAPSVQVEFDFILEKY